MKTIIISIFLLVASFVHAQTSDFMYVPDEKSLVATYNSSLSGVGFYMGGFILTSFPAPYTYTTPVSRFNRLGLSFSNHQVSFMAGGFVENFRDSISIQPDLWLKVYPLRILTNTKMGFDFVVGVNYMKDLRYGVGLSIPFASIYYR